MKYETTTVEIMDTKFLVAYTLAKPDGTVKINNLSVFPYSGATKINDFLSDGAKKLIGIEVSKNLEEDYDNVFFSESEY